jgi:hypothetical protein
MSESWPRPELAATMKISMTSDCRLNGLALGLVLVGMAHLTAATNASRNDEAWPALLSAEPVRLDPAIAFLQQRARGSLERLVQSAATPQPR